MKKNMIRMFLVIIYFVFFAKVFADTNYDALYITKGNISDYKINVEVTAGDLLFNYYTVKFDAEQYISATCSAELREATVQVGDNKKSLIAFPIKVDSEGSISYSFNVDKGFIATSTITLLYNKGSGCNMNLGSPVVIELESWVN